VLLEWGDVVTGSTYEIRIRGRLTDALRSAFPEMSASVEPAETVTVLQGKVIDQAALHGLLDKIESLGIELVEVRRVSGAGDAPDAPDTTAPPQINSA
jgi:hypothetical protein